MEERGRRCSEPAFLGAGGGYSAIPESGRVLADQTVDILKGLWPAKRKSAYPPLSAAIS